MQAMQKRWRLLQVSQNQLVSLPDSFSAHPAAPVLLAHRGIVSEEQARDFLEPQWEGKIHDPFRFSSMQKAVERVFQAFELGERITVHGDYDADGVTGSAVVI